MHLPMHWQLVPAGSTLRIGVSLGQTQNATVDGVVKINGGNYSTISSGQLMPGPYVLQLGPSQSCFVMLDATFLASAGGSAKVTSSVVDAAGTQIAKALTRTLTKASPGHDTVAVSVDTV